MISILIVLPPARILLLSQRRDATIAELREELDRLHGETAAFNQETGVLSAEYESLLRRLQV